MSQIYIYIYFNTNNARKKYINVYIIMRTDIHIDIFQYLCNNFFITFNIDFNKYRCIWQN